MTGAPRALASLALLLTASSLAAQDRAPAVLVSGAGAGLYFGEPSSYNGPVLAARFGRQLNRYVVLGLRGEFRDDDPSGGRVQSVGLGPEVMLLAPTLGAQLYLVGGALVEAVHVGSPPPATFTPDLASGIHLRPHVGAGLAAHTSRATVLFETLRAVTGGTSYTMVQLGVVSQPGPHDGTPAPAAAMHANALAPLSDAYRSHQDYRGYTLAVDFPVRTRLGEALRASAGIDFVRFEISDGYEYSTGALELLVGTVVPLLRTPSNVFTLSVVPQLGAMLFFEPSGMPPYPLGMVTV
ncbi:MAG: hypothetical protein OER21_16965, partial [Gemmatimonadota bacterium]|nr:hypothetical protein [Gemmatimonadota bacterium]